jgi:phage tail sheath gpL-like
MANSYEMRILRVLEHIRDNPAGDLSLDALADVAAMSRSAGVLKLSARCANPASFGLS